MRRERKSKSDQKVRLNHEVFIDLERFLVEFELTYQQSKMVLDRSNTMEDMIDIEPKVVTLNEDQSLIIPLKVH